MFKYQLASHVSSTLFWFTQCTYNMVIKIIIVHDILFSCCVLLGEVTGQCLKECGCLQHGGNIKLQCDRRNLTQFPLASALPENITVINFQDNKIQRLPTQPLGFRRTKVWSIKLARLSWESISKHWRLL